MTVKYDIAGNRFRSLQYAVLELSEVAFPDFPVKGGIRVFVWGANFMIKQANSFTAWDSKWRTEMKLQLQDAQVELHQSLCKIMETGLIYDQLNMGNIAMGEMMMRELMVIEERYKDRALNHQKDNVERALFLGSEQRINLCIHPELIKYIGEEMRAEALILKERRKAREERALLKPPKNNKDEK
jgi:hypothetical protein